MGAFLTKSANLELARVARLIAEEAEEATLYDGVVYLCSIAYDVCDYSFPHLPYEYSLAVHEYFGPDNYLGGVHDGLNAGVWKNDIDSRLIGAYLLAEILEDECR